MKLKLLLLLICIVTSFQLAAQNIQIQNQSFKKNYEAKQAAHKELAPLKSPVSKTQYSKKITTYSNESKKAKHKSIQQNKAKRGQQKFQKKWYDSFPNSKWPTHSLKQ